MKLITTQLQAKLPQDHKLLIHTIVNLENINELIKLLNKTTKIEIYDLTSTQTLPCFNKLRVRDHINRTGNNPLIGKQNELNIDFIDMSNVYHYQEPAIITDCCGKKLNLDYSYPSHYLCNLTILARAMGKIKILAHLINII